MSARSFYLARWTDLPEHVHLEPEPEPRIFACGLLEDGLQTGLSVTHLDSKTRPWTLNIPSYIAHLCFCAGAPPDGFFDLVLLALAFSTFIRRTANP